jgi:phosphatidylserine decarboxylase
LFPKLQRFFPQRALSDFAGLCANCRLPWIKNRLIQYFVWKYPVNLTEAQETNPYQYATFNDFFTRRLQSTARPISSGIHDLVSPADGCISQLGNIDHEKIFQAKGHHFTVQELLGGDQKLSAPFMNGSFLTAYLAPKDYHRVHMPLDGHLSHMIYVPGRLFSVNFKTAETIPNLFARNERVIAFFNTSIGRVAIVLVGAMIVGSIETVWAGTITPPRRQSIQTWDYQNPIFLKRGAEMGCFKLGSTVILLFEPNTVAWDQGLATAHPIQVGQRLGMFKPDRW